MTKGTAFPELADIRRWFADELRFTAGIRSERLVEAFAAVPREAFLGPPPWKIWTAHGDGVDTFDPAQLYHNVVIALKEAADINNGQPALWAAAFDALDIASGECVLQAGAGTGYYSAILSELAGPEGCVIAAEIDPDLASMAADNLRPWAQAHVHDGDALNVQDGPFDVIVAFAGLTGIPMQWLLSLRENGRLLMPLTWQRAQTGRDALSQRGGQGSFLLVRRQSNGFAAQFLQTVYFIHCVGGRDDSMNARLSGAFAKRDMSEVKSLRLNTPPDDTSWVEGDGWWLSTAPP